MSKHLCIPVAEINALPLVKVGEIALRVLLSGFYVLGVFGVGEQLFDIGRGCVLLENKL